MTVLKDIGIYKNRLLSHFLSNTDFCDVMLQKKDYTDDDIDNLMYSQLFPYLYVDGTQTEVMPYVDIEIVMNAGSGTVKNMLLYVDTFAHKDCMVCNQKGYLGNRCDILADIIERSLHDCKDFGIGRFQLLSVGYLNVSSDYYGRRMIFSVPDFLSKDIKKK